VFMFLFGSLFDVRHSAFGVRRSRSAREPNLNTNAEARTLKREPPGTD